MMDYRIKTVLDHIEDHLASGLRLEELASIACMSVSNFHRIFKIETGTTPFKFIEELKINRACQLILKERTAVHDITLKLGYRDYETFSRAFKRYFYLSPDDLKSVASKIRAEYGSEEIPELMFLSAEEDSTDDEIRDKFQELLSKRGISPDQLPMSTAYKVERLPGEVGKAVSIDKKLSITTDKKLWSTLIKSHQNG